MPFKRALALKVKRDESEELKKELEIFNDLKILLGFSVRAWWVVQYSLACRPLPVCCAQRGLV